VASHHQHQPLQPSQPVSLSTGKPTNVPRTPPSWLFSNRKLFPFCNQPILPCQGVAYSISYRDRLAPGDGRQGAVNRQVNRVVDEMH